MTPRDLTFSPPIYSDRAALQAMVQGTGHTSMDFSRPNQLLFLAKDHNQIVGFITGERSYDEPHILTLGTPYFYSYCYNDPHIDMDKATEEMELGFLEYAHEELSVTEYRMNWYEDPIPIGRALLAHTMEKSLLTAIFNEENAVIGPVEKPEPAPNLAHETLLEFY